MPLGEWERALLQKSTRKAHVAHDLTRRTMRAHRDRDDGLKAIDFYASLVQMGTKQKILVAFILVMWPWCLPADNSAKPRWQDQRVSIHECLVIGDESFADERYSFGNIMDIAVSPTGRLVVLDGKTKRILEYARDGRFLHYVGKGEGDGPGEFRMPWVMAIDGQENVYVTDQGTSKVLVFDENGSFIRSFATRFGPVSMAVDARGCVYLGYVFAKAEGVYVYKHDRSGKLLMKFGRPADAHIAARVEASGNGGKMCLLPDGNLVYSFHYPYDTRVYSPAGALLQKISRQNKRYRPPQENKTFNCFESQSGCVAVGALPDGKIVNLLFVAGEGEKGGMDYLLDIFSQNGEWLATLPLGRFHLDNVRALASDKEGALYFASNEPYPHVRKFMLRFR